MRPIPACLLVHPEEITYVNALAEGQTALVALVEPIIPAKLVSHARAAGGESHKDVLGKDLLKLGRDEATFRVVHGRVGAVLRAVPVLDKDAEERIREDTGRREPREEEVNDTGDKSESQILCARTMRRVGRGERTTWRTCTRKSCSPSRGTRARCREARECCRRPARRWRVSTR